MKTILPSFVPIYQPEAVGHKGVQNELKHSPERWAVAMIVAMIAGWAADSVSSRVSRGK
jgi:hypothetical protein